MASTSPVADESHHGAIASVHGQLGHGLQVESMVIWRSLPAMAGLVASTCRTCPRLSTTTCAGRPRPVQPIVVLALEAELADHGAGLVLGELRQVQFIFADLTGIANDVSEHAVPRIEAGLRRYDDQLGEEIVVRIDKGEGPPESSLLEAMGS